jgi:type I restriction enzyme S subunit
MRDNWTETAISDVAEVLSGFAFKSELFSEIDGIPLIRIRDLQKRKFTEVGYTGDYEERYLVNSGDFLIGMDGGFRCYEWLGPKALLNQRVCRIQSFDELEVIPRFVFFLVNQYLEKIEESTSFTTVKHISVKQVKDIRFPLPPLAEQRRIVDVVSSVDAYIDALEQQVDAARTAFTSLCMSTFSSSEHTQKLSEVAKVIMGQSPEGATCNSEGVGTPLLTGPTEFTNRIVGPPRQWTSKETKISEDGDILFCVRGATAGRINLGTYRAVIGRGLASIRCVLESDTNLVRYALGVGMSQLLPAAGGTIFPNVSQSQLRDFKLWWPPEIERSRISNILTSIEDVIQATERAVVEAKNLRSGLLSDLLSGEHEIPVSYDELLGAA